MEILSPTMLRAATEFIKAHMNALAHERSITPQDVMDTMARAADILTDDDRQRCGSDDPFSLAAALQQRMIIAASPET